MRGLAAIACLTAAAGCGGSLAVSETLLRPETARGQSCIAVLPFENATRLEGAGTIVASAFATTLRESGRVNPLGPDEIVRLLTVMQTRFEASTRLAEIQAYGQALGVPAVLTGTVTELAAPRSGSSIKNAVVGFVAELVATDSGELLWTASASNYHHAILLDTAEPRAEILRQAVTAATSQLLFGRGIVTSLPPCATLQVRLASGDLTPPKAPLPPPPPVPLAPPEPTTPAPEPPPTTTAAVVTPAGAEPNLAATASAHTPQPLPPTPLPAQPSAPGTTPLPALPGASTPGTTPLPSLPAPSAPGTTPLPSLPASDLPALPPAPGATTAAPAGDLPALPSDLPALPPDAGAAGDLNSLLPALPAGAPPRALLAALPAAARDTAQRLYAGRPVSLAGTFPNYTKGVLSLSPKAKKLLDNVLALLRASPTMAVRIHVRTPTGVGELAQLSADQAQLVRVHVGKLPQAHERVDVDTTEAPTPAGRKPAKNDNVLEVVVLRY